MNMAQTTDRAGSCRSSAGFRVSGAPCLAAAAAGRCRQPSCPHPSTAASHVASATRGIRIRHGKPELVTRWLTAMGVPQSGRAEGGGRGHHRLCIPPFLQAFVDEIELTRWLSLGCEVTWLGYRKLLVDLVYPPHLRSQPRSLVSRLDIFQMADTREGN